MIKTGQLLFLNLLFALLKRIKTLDIKIVLIPTGVSWAAIRTNQLWSKKLTKYNALKFQRKKVSTVNNLHCRLVSTPDSNSLCRKNSGTNAMKINGQVLPIAVHEAAKSKTLIKLKSVARNNGFESRNFTDTKLTILVDFNSAILYGFGVFIKFQKTWLHQYFKH